MADGDVTYDNTTTGNIITYDAADVTYDGDIIDDNSWAWTRAAT
jgi:hypothetical protein